MSRVPLQTNEHENPGFKLFTKFSCIKIFAYKVSLDTMWFIKYSWSLIITLFNVKQVDNLISKNQALQVLYLKHCVYKTT